MIIIGGLGNPGKEYMLTRHNLGFSIIKKLSQLLELTWQNKPDLVSEIAKDKEHILFKPLAYVNESGRAVSQVTNYFKIEPANLWIIHDDTEIPFGEVRIKMGGTSGGHNGIKSIDEAIGPNYWRIRVGVGRPIDHNYDLADYVLGRFNSEEKRLLPRIVDQVTSYLLQSLADKQITAISFNTLNDQEK